MDLSPAWLLGWRFLYALGFALAPWALPPDAAPPASADALMLRALVGAVALAALSVRLARALRAPRPHPWPVYTALATLAAALVAAAALPTARVPLGASCWVVAPLAWTTLAGLVAAARPSAPPRAALALVAALGLVTYGASFGRVRSLDALWTATVRAAPTHTAAWRALVARAPSPADARALLDRCVLSAPRAWECSLDRAELALRARDFPTALRHAERVLLLREGHPRASTLRALSLAQQVPVPAEALDIARLAVDRDPRSADAHFAFALCLDAAGRSGEARGHADTARSLGGGPDVVLLQSLLALRAGNNEEARRQVETAMRRAADPARAYFQLGLVEQQAGRYNAAREAYLRSAAIDRTGYAARYNLATLAHGAGADEEARHHLEVLLRHHPNDVAALTLLRAIDRAPPSPTAALRPAQ
jgi:tetratricopeptide (TPR) repeat protein